MNREQQVAKAGDMMTIDRGDILSSVIHGADYRSRITMETQDALYVTYAPEGINREQLLGHVRDILDGIQMFSSDAGAEPVRILSTQGIEVVSVSTRSLVVPRGP